MAFAIAATHASEGLWISCETSATVVVKHSTKSHVGCSKAKHPKACSWLVSESKKVNATGRKFADGGDAATIMVTARGR